VCGLCTCVCLCVVCVCVCGVRVCVCGGGGWGLYWDNMSLRLEREGGGVGVWSVYVCVVCVCVGVWFVYVCVVCVCVGVLACGLCVCGVCMWGGGGWSLGPGRLRYASQHNYSLPYKYVVGLEA